MLALGVIGLLALIVFLVVVDNMWQAYQDRKVEEARLAARYPPQKDKAQSQARREADE
jgi:hypothetical protein